jgi:hypothetical protein
LVRSTADWGLDKGDHRQENDIQGREVKIVSSVPLLYVL